MSEQKIYVLVVTTEGWDDTEKIHIEYVGNSLEDASEICQRLAHDDTYDPINYAEVQVWVDGKSNTVIQL